MTSVRSPDATRTAEIRHYPCDHFDLFPGKPWHDAAVHHATRFLARRLTVHEDEVAPV